MSSLDLSTQDSPSTSFARLDTAESLSYPQSPCVPFNTPIDLINSVDNSLLPIAFCFAGHSCTFALGFQIDRSTFTPSSTSKPFLIVSGLAS